MRTLQIEARGLADHMSTSGIVCEANRRFLDIRMAACGYQQPVASRITWQASAIRSGPSSVTRRRNVDRDSV